MAKEWEELLWNNEHLEDFIKHILMKSKNSQYTYLYHLKQICEFFQWNYAEFDPKNLNQEKYDLYFKEKSKNHKKSSLNLFSNILRVLNNIYNLNIKINQVKETDRFSDYITFEELQVIINKADKEVAALSAFIFCTGLRTISIKSIKKEQLMLNTKHPYIKNVLLKGGRRQDIVILYPEIVIPMLKWYMQYKSIKVKDYDKNPFVFRSQRGKISDSYIYDVVKRASQILGKNVNPRMLRKGLGVHTKELGLQDEVRRMIMGHSDVATTIKSYSDYSIKDIAREIQMKIPHNDIQNIQNQNSIVQSSQIQNQEFCPYCGQPVEYEMVLCPHCWEEIKVACNGCKRFINSKWKKCAYCGAEVKKEKKKYDYAL